MPTLLRVTIDIFIIVSYILKLQYFKFKVQVVTSDLQTHIHMDS